MVLFRIPAPPDYGRMSDDGILQLANLPRRQIEKAYRDWHRIEYQRDPTGDWLDIVRNELDRLEWQLALSIGITRTTVARGATSCTTSTGTTTSGSTVVIGACYTAGVFSSFTENKGNGAPTAIQTELSNSGASSRMAYWKNITGGTLATFTLNLNAADFGSVFVIEIIGADTTAPLDQSDRRVDSVSPYTLAAGLTTTQADECLISMCHGIAGGTNTYAEGSIGISGLVSQTDGNNDWSGSMGSVIKAAIASYNPSWTNTGGSDNGVWEATFKAASGGGGGATIGDQNLRATRRGALLGMGRGRSLSPAISMSAYYRERERAQREFIAKVRRAA